MTRLLVLALALVVTFAAGIASARFAPNRFQVGSIYSAYQVDTLVPGVKIIPVVDTMGGTCTLVYTNEQLVPFGVVKADEGSCLLTDTQ